MAAQSGVYRFHVMASGVTLRGKPFTREQLLTGAVFLGGNHPLPHGGTGCSCMCCLLECLLKDKSVIEFLKQRKLDPATLLRCVDGCCKGHR